MQPLKFRNISYEIRHLDTRDRLSDEELSQYLPSEDKAKLLTMERDVEKALKLIDENEENFQEENLEMISFYVENGEITRVSYRMKS